MTTGPLAGRVALVTGGGRGIGRAHALALAADGAAVMVNDLGTTLDGRGRDAAPAEAVAATIRSAGGEARADTTDVASVDGGRRAVARTIEAFGRIDILVNNAGFAHGGGTVEQPVEHEIDALLDVHLKAALGTMSAAFADMRRRGWGRIVNTVSEASLDPRFVGWVGYAAAKAALWAATLAAAAEGAPEGITVNAISPGARTRMNAELIDAGFRNGSSSALDLDPAHVAAVAAYLVSDAAADITGRIVHAAGGELREYTTTRSARTPLVERLLAAGVASVGRRHAERPHHERGGSGDDALDVGRVDLGQ
jgi:NAD(P)-dependent dehydrogenase (short-subunit alcohol dehydrogenase family)